MYNQTISLKITSYTKPAAIPNNEKILVSECISGNRIMQNNLYAQYSPVMFGICLRYSKSRQDAEEILQEGFIKVFTCLHQYQFKGTLEGWIKRIIINCALQRLRNKNTLYSVAFNESFPEDILHEELIIDNINTKELLQLIQNLPTMCRLVFNLYVFENMKHREIAKMLDITEGTSKSNLHDARVLLQRSIAKENPVSQINSSA